MKDAIEPINEPRATKPSSAVTEPMRDANIKKPFNWTRFCIVCVVPVIFVYLSVVVYYSVGVPEKIKPVPKEQEATKQIGHISQKCKSYFIRNQAWPASLQVLLTPDQHKMVYLNRPEMLIDPWGQPMIYDPSGAKNNGTQPDIWTVAPDGAVIGNWTKAQK